MFRDFTLHLKKIILWEIPVESLYEDENGYFVWRGKGQKVCQPNSTVDNKFQIEKVYVTLGNKRTDVNGPCQMYQELTDSGNLELYDMVLGKHVPENLKDGDTVFYKKYQYLFQPEDVVKIEIPDFSETRFLCSGIFCDTQSC